MNLIILTASVAIGVLMVFILKPTTKLIQLLLSFSGAYLLSITVLHLLPEVFESHEKNIGIYVLIGILLQTILEYFSKGAEHGHIHIHPYTKGVPWLLFISLSAHAFLEGIPLGNGANGLLLWAIVIHKIPITLVLYIFLLQSSLPKKVVYVFIIAFAIMSPLGLLLSNQIAFFNEHHAEVTGVIIGVFLHIATAILFESTQNHQFNTKKFMAVLLGFAVAFASTQFAVVH